ncbi:uncharacterized protein LOC128743164 [Sabethes cyaneus]|uniref:uncharacterized protein LOC128743164 n=1 Tax=Sabethes cyaneus TaxID=53552 RepID=UPI00237EA49A|nr:uncharacterized protein LOC128743164 [Sabethes cyaneus]
MLKLIGLSCLFVTCTGVPFINWKIGDQNSNGGPTIFNKLQDFGEKVYEGKRNFLNGINEKVSNLLWIPPLSTTTELIATSTRTTTTTTTTNAPVKIPQHVPYEEDERLIFSSNDNDADHYTLNLAIYARSSFLSPEEFNQEHSLTAFGSTLAVKVNNNFSLLKNNLSQ